MNIESYQFLKQHYSRECNVWEWYSCNKTEISKEILFCTMNTKVIYNERDSEDIIWVVVHD